MIPLSRVVTEIEKHVAVAKGKGDEQSIRESLVAIRALCDVALSEQPEVKLQVMPIQYAQPVQPVHTVQSTSSVPSISAGERMKEDDANGDSLFDF
ncbi:YwdI family protein [Paenisporosarcina sp. FSL H8-0542]|uniref:YwdI family protein n=1 Tax=Paenisporosarcina sp. FSL H8-0542 TaxID=2921401 RepID=UPI003159B5D3